MRIIPVIDLKHGRVVRGVGGRRAEYRPIESVLCDQATPSAVGGAFRQLGFVEAYVADLDAIAGQEPDWRAYQALIDGGLALMVDAGIARAEQAGKLAEFAYRGQRLQLILGLESVTNLAELASTVRSITPARLIFSLDLRGGVPVTNLAEWQASSAESIAGHVIGLGIQRLIVLDIAAVGLNGGVSTLDLCRRLRESHPRLGIISGGGVRSIEDLQRLADAGCDAALIASALHDGRIAAENVQSFGRIRSADLTT